MLSAEAPAEAPAQAGTAVGSPGLLHGPSSLTVLLGSSRARCSAHLARAAALVQSQSDGVPWAPSPAQSAGGTADKHLPGIARGARDTHTRPLVSEDAGLGREHHGGRGHTGTGVASAHTAARAGLPAHVPRPHTLSGLGAPGPGIGFLTQQAFWKLHSFSRHGPARLTGT